MAHTDPHNPLVPPPPHGPARVTGGPDLAAPMTPESAGAAGLGWVDANHPLYGTPGYVGSQPAATPGAAAVPAATPGAAAPADTGSFNDKVVTPGVAAQTVSTTPAADPDAATTNQGTQDVVRNSWLQRALQTPTANGDDPNIRAQSDVFSAAQERARRDQVADSAEHFAGSGQTGAQTVEERLINEKSSNTRAAFEGDLVTHDLQRQRDEVVQGLQALGGTLDADQNRLLQTKLAEIDAALKRESLTSTTDLGNKELDLKRLLGMAGVNVSLLGLNQDQNQFNSTMGFNIGDREAYYNQQALDSMMGQ